MDNNIKIDAKQKTLPITLSDNGKYGTVPKLLSVLAYVFAPKIRLEI